MKKVVYRAFGGLDVLELIDTNVPEVGSGTVLVRVKAAAINPVDWKMREGQVKFLTGWRMPQGQGLEFSGVIERVGRSVTGYAAGDEVFGAAKDCLAEFVVAAPGKIAKKPSGVSFEAASTIAAVGTTAASLFDRVSIGPGTEVLINGATGGIGMFVTQLAVGKGARVTAVVSEKGVGFVKRWGVHEIIDYRVTDILALGRQFDVVVELSDKLPFKTGRLLVKPGGKYVASLPNPAEILSGLVTNLYAKQKYGLMGMRARTDVLAALADDVAARRVEVVVGQTFALTAFREAYAQASAGRFVGKVVFTVGETP
jgi:NADPH:quinone reductase-like Zn-dependent oxidoreductase